MRILLHICCGPCATYPLSRLRAQGHEVSGWFYNPNIHPFQEFRRRLETAAQFAGMVDLPLALEERYGLTGFLRQVVHHEEERCVRCYIMRLTRTAEVAAEQGFEGFTSTLLYSKYQNHARLQEEGSRLARQFGLTWHDEDFRRGWQEGIDASKRLGLYRQPYCGCIYSEQERYDKSLRRR